MFRMIRRKQATMPSCPSCLSDLSWVAGEGKGITGSARVTCRSCGAFLSMEFTKKGIIVRRAEHPMGQGVDKGLVIDAENEVVIQGVYIRGDADTGGAV
jgi:hypothetical protein